MKDIKYSKIIQDMSSKEDLQLLDFTEAVARGRTDPVFFGEYFLGVHFHPAQKVWLWLTTRNKIEDAYDLAMAYDIKLPPLEEVKAHNFLKNILSPSNRFGKTFVTSIKHIWYNFYKIGVTGPPEFIADLRYPTLNISPHSLQVNAAYRYVVDIFDDKFIYEWEGKKVRNRCRIKSFLVDHKEVKRELIFDNGSYIKGVPTGEDQASSLAGTQFFYISYDEAPQSMHLQEELPAKIQSRLIDSGGPLDIIGTPEVDKPSHAYYQRIAKYGLKMKDGFFTLQGKISDNTFIGDKEKNSVLESIRQTDPEKYLQVAFGQFITSGSKLFDTACIDNIWNSNLRFLTSGESGHDYIIHVDWGFSDTGDPTVIGIIDYTNIRLAMEGKYLPQFHGKLYRTVYHERIMGGSPYVVLAKVRLLQQDFNDAQLIHDSSSMGGVMIKKMLREMKTQHLHDFFTSNGSKDELLFLLVRAITFAREPKAGKEGEILELNPLYGKLESPVIAKLEEQMGMYRVEDTKLEQDEVMSLGLGIWWLEKKFAGQKTKIFDINLFGSTPDQVLRVHGEKRRGGLTIPVKNFTIKTRII